MQSSIGCRAAVFDLKHKMAILFWHWLELICYSSDRDFICYFASTSSIGILNSDEAAQSAAASLWYSALVAVSYVQLCTAVASQSHSRVSQSTSAAAEQRSGTLYLNSCLLERVEISRVWIVQNPVAAALRLPLRAARCSSL